MGQVGFERRLARCFREDGRSVIVAMDHSAFMDAPARGLDEAGATIRAALEGGADAFMVPRGTARVWSAELRRAGFILSVPLAEASARSVVELALELGADMIKTMLYPFTPSFSADSSALMVLATECERWGVPLMVETIPGGFAAGPEMHTPDKIAAAARIGVELGANAIKTFHPGDGEGVARLCEYARVPVVVLGGEKTADELGLLRKVREAILAGAAGVAMGRNVWGHARPGAIARALAAVVHEGVSAEEAAQRYL